MESRFDRSSLFRSHPTPSEYDYEEIRKPGLKKVLTAERLYGVEKDILGRMVPRNRINIMQTRFNFDVDRVREEFNRSIEETRAVEDNLYREKAILREAFILRQRRRMEPEQLSRKFN